MVRDDSRSQCGNNRAGPSCLCDATVDIIEINTHCGLEFARIEYQGSVWRFEHGAVLESTERWPSFTTVFQIYVGESGPVVRAPDGSKWVLIPTDPDDRPDLTCI